ncbi:MAG: FadR family transcriptional regulator [Caldilineae bacterium]|nr:MAG: FadR family transcriptional regulator [Caldilineae bacterium]
MSTTPIELFHKSLVEQVSDAIMDMIEREGLRPGDRLPATAVLTETFGVSRPVVREALKMLEGRGVIEMSGGRTAVIKPVSGEVLHSFFERVLTFEREKLREILEVRYGIEMQCARLAAQRRTPEQATALQELVAEMAQHLDDAESYAELDVRLHLLVAEATHNSLLYHLVHSIRDVLRDVIREGLDHRLTASERHLVQVAHERVVHAITAGDPEAAAKAMAFHFDDALRAIFE